MLRAVVDATKTFCLTDGQQQLEGSDTATAAARVYRSLLKCLAHSLASVTHTSTDNDYTNDNDSERAVAMSDNTYSSGNLSTTQMTGAYVSALDALRAYRATVPNAIDVS